MAATLRERTLSSDAQSQVRFIVDQLFRDGQHWIRGISTTDWRRVRYAGRVRRPTTNGPSINGIADSSEVLSGYISKPATMQTGAAHNYLIVRPDKACMDSGGVALLRLVLKLNFDNEPQLNFHVWFHDLSQANMNDHLMIGWRLECPEGGGSAHDFFHAQPLRKYGEAQISHGMHERFPESFPTIPLPASSVVELCLAAVLVACGKDALRNFVRHSGNAEVREAAKVFWAKLFPVKTLVKDA